MHKLEHIKQQIGQLSSSEFAALRDWVLEQDWLAWDAQIEHDARTGKLDALAEEARAEYEARPSGPKPRPI